MSTNVVVRDLDLMGPGVADGRRLEVVVNGLPLFGGSQIAVDTTLVSALHSDGTLAMADFGQTDFGQLFDRFWPNVGLTDFGQF